MTVKQISVFVENAPGQLSEFAKLMEQNNVDLRALSIAEAEDFGILRVIVDDSYKAMRLLKDEGYVCSVTPVVAVVIPDKPGSLVHILEALDDNGVNIEYMYAFISRKKDSACMIFRVADNEKAIDVLKGVGVKPLCQDDMAELFED